MKELLEFQADRIESTFSEFGILGRVYAGTILPQVVVFQIQTGPGQRIADIRRLNEELAMRLEVPGILVSRSDGVVCVEVPRPDRKTISVRTLMALLTQIPPSQTALLGLSKNGEPLMAHFPSPSVAHMLIAGMTGSGKTELLRTIIVTLSLWGRRRDTVIYLVDPKHRKLASLGCLQSVMGVYDAGQAAGLLDQLLVEMDRRDHVVLGNHIYVVIDELADLVMVERAIEVALTRLVQRGREAGIHVVAATQRPSAQVVAGLMRANFPVRITGAVNSAAEAAIATGMPKSGAELLLGKGDMVLVYQGKMERFQAGLFGEADRFLVDHLVREDRVEPVEVQVGEPESLKEQLRERLNLHGPGRPALGATKEMIQYALGQLMATGKCSQRALRQWHQIQNGTDVNPPRAAEAIQKAQQLLALTQKGQQEGAE